MAEAHSAVAFSFAIGHDGVHLNYDSEVLHVIFHSGIRSWRRRLYRFKNNVSCGVFPGSLSSMAFSVAAFNGIYFRSNLQDQFPQRLSILDKLPADFDPSFGAVQQLMKQLRRLNFEESLLETICASTCGIAVWLGSCWLMKHTLRLLYSYKGWMYEQRGKGRKVSVVTTIWLATVKLLTCFSSPMLYSYQGSLPSLPVPALKDTMQRYLRSVRPLLDDQNYERMSKLAHEFENGIGNKLQRYLVLKSWWATNYVSDWWEEFVYLRGRSPIMVNSNFYGTDAILMHPTTVQAARAANVCHSAFLFRRQIDRQALTPIMIQNSVPLCSSQYERTFNTTRIPGVETDHLAHFDDSTHIVVMHAGRFFRVPCYYKGVLLTPKEMQIQFETILNDPVLPDKGEDMVAALTAGDRKPWAEARMKYFQKGCNRVSLEAIEKAAFVLVLEHNDVEYDSDPTHLDSLARAMLHGKGNDRWYDKSFNIIVLKSARIGFNGEHSWADAPIMGHMWEYVMANDMLETGYDDDGNCLGSSNVDPPPPQKLRFELNEDCLSVIMDSFRVAEALLNDVDLHLFMFKTFGKGLMKKCRLSPDAFIQMALQLAYYRDAGKFQLTYEASMTRLYREGRTETVRPCSIESATWVKAMVEKDPPKALNNEEKIRLLQKACAYHQLGYQNAMCGKGIDRHLFCLYVVSKYLEIDSPFLKEVLSEPWRLSTSQTPHGQTNKLDLEKHPDCISAGGGFGPVADDGYGVSYIIAGEDTLFFHISSKRSSSVTDSMRFANQIETALVDMSTLFAK